METVHVDYLIERNAVHQTSELPVFHAAEAVAPLIRIVGVAGVIFQHIEPAVIDLERVDLALCGVDLLELVGGGVVAEQLFPTQEVERTVLTEVKAVRCTVRSENCFRAAVRLAGDKAVAFSAVGFPVVAEPVVDRITGLHGKSALIVVAHLSGHGGIDAAVMADALAGQQQTADDHSDLRARGGTLRIETPSVLAGKDACGVHPLHCGAELRIHSSKVRDALIVERGQVVRAQHVGEQPCQLLTGDGR